MQGTISDLTLRYADRYRDNFAEASPFRHVLMDSFLTPEFLDSILAQFRSGSREDDQRIRRALA